MMLFNMYDRQARERRSHIKTKMSSLGLQVNLPDGVGMTIPTLLLTTQHVFTRDCASLSLSWSILYGELPIAILMVSSQLSCQWDMCMRCWFRDKQSERGWQGGGLATQWHLLATVQAVTLFVKIYVWKQWADWLWFSHFSYLCLASHIAGQCPAVSTPLHIHVSLQREC